MSKRRNENGQMRREDVEALDDNEDDDVAAPQGFVKATSEQLATRKIVKVKKPVKEAPGPRNDTENQSSNQPKSNPFAALGSFFLTGAASINKSDTSSSLSSSKPDEKAKETSKQPTTTVAGTYEAKMKALNENFLQWMDVQMKLHPVGLWTDAMKDYIKHAEQISQTCKRLDGAKSNISFPKAPEQTIGKGVSSVSVPIKAPTPAPTPAPAPAPVQAPAVTFGSSEKTNESATNAAASKNSAWLAFPPSKFQSDHLAFGANTAGSVSAPSNPTGGTDASNVPKSVAVEPKFAFGSSSAPTFQMGQSTDKPAAPAFSLPSFSFPSSGSAALPMFTSFGSSSLPSFGGSLPVPTATGETEEGGDDDEGEPILEPEKALRNENDKDEILFDASSKLMRFDKGSKEWKDMGKGSFRVTSNPDTKKPRMLMRNLTGKIMFNAGFFKDMKFEKVKGGVKFSAVTSISESGQGELNMFIVKVKETEVHKLHSTLTKAVIAL